MRSYIIIAIALSVLTVSAQEEGTGVQVASMLPQDGGGKPAKRWSGGGGTFLEGRTIEPVTMRMIPWEFGDGSLSRVLPPRPWRASDRVVERTVPMAPWRERNGGSPCVAAAEEWRNENDRSEPRPRIVSENGVPVLVTTGLGARCLVVRLLDPVSGLGPALERDFASGRWVVSGPEGMGRPMFITLQDLATGERWRAGVAP